MFTKILIIAAIILFFCLLFIFHRAIIDLFISPRVEFYVIVPDYTPETEGVCLTGNHPILCNWRQPGLPLKKIGPNLYYVSFRVPQGTRIRYKFIRSSWDKVEKDRQFNEVANRRIRVQQSITINHSVANWSDFQDRIIPSTLTGNFKQHTEFRSKFLNNSRTVMVYLPPSYQSENKKHYPVFYMHDGNNLFDRATAFGGVEWEVDETAEALIHEDVIEEIIVVGIYNTAGRMYEYSPTPMEGYGGGGGDKYASFIIDELKPFIDKEYRTLPGRETTGVMGSSMGGLISLYLGFKYSHIFSLVGAMSSSLWWGNGFIIDFISGQKKPEKTRIWLDTGTDEGGIIPGQGISSMIRDNRKLKKALQKIGFKSETDLFYMEAKGHGHNEAAWAARMKYPLIHFFGKKREISG